MNDQKIDPKRYMIVPRTLIFLTREDRVLLIKGSPAKKLYPGQYNGLGGHVEKGEDVLTAALRELREEAGIRDVDLHLAGILIVDTGENTGVGVFVFRGTGNQAELHASREGTPKWIPVESLHEYPLVADLAVLLPRVLAHPWGQPPFLGRIHSKGGKTIVEIGA